MYAWAYVRLLWGAGARRWARAKEKEEKEREAAGEGPHAYTRTQGTGEAALLPRIC